MIKHIISVERVPNRLEKAVITFRFVALDEHDKGFWVEWPLDQIDVTNIKAFCCGLENALHSLVAMCDPAERRFVQGAPESPTVN